MKHVFLKLALVLRLVWAALLTNASKVKTSPRQVACTGGGAFGLGGLVPASAPTDHIVFYGDSDIEYWNISQDFPGAVNCGVAGATAREVAIHVTDMVEIFRPKGFVVLIAGENDIGLHMPVEAIFEDFKKVIEVILASSHQPRVILIGTKPEPSTRKLHPSYKRYDALCKDYIAQLTGAIPPGTPPPAVFIDAWQGFMDLGNPRSLYREDGLHCTEAGYSHLVRWVKEAMRN